MTRFWQQTSAPEYHQATILDPIQDDGIPTPSELTAVENAGIKDL